jgi:hypothetical protein
VLQRVYEEIGSISCGSEDTLKLDAMRRAAQLGLADIISGRFWEVYPGAIDTAVESLGVEAGKRLIKTAWCRSVPP